jgi:hypothetical protein
MTFSTPTLLPDYNGRASLNILSKYSAELYLYVEVDGCFRSVYCLHHQGMICETTWRYIPETLNFILTAVRT